MSWLSLFLIFSSLASFVAGQILLKKAMELSDGGMRRGNFLCYLGAGVAAMTVSFFLTLGLLRHFELSYLYPFQGLSVIIIALAAALLLREKLTWQLAIGACLISLGVVLVSLS